MAMLSVAAAMDIAGAGVSLAGFKEGRLATLRRQLATVHLQTAHQTGTDPFVT
jgi:hypothetical protein